MEPKTRLGFFPVVCPLGHINYHPIWDGTKIIIEDDKDRQCWLCTWAISRDEIIRGMTLYQLKKQWDAENPDFPSSKFPKGPGDEKHE